MMSAVATALAFVVVIFIFVVYDLLVRRRNENLIKKAARSNAVVSDMFPSAIRDKILHREDGEISTRKKMKSFLNDGKVYDDTANKPLAELYLETTVLMADLVGFTPWSSLREPFQVFTLLETLYQAFDEVSKSHSIHQSKRFFVAIALLSAVFLPDRKATQGFQG